MGGQVTAVLAGDAADQGGTMLVGRRAHPGTVATDAMLAKRRLRGGKRTAGHSQACGLLQEPTGRRRQACVQNSRGPPGKHLGGPVGGDKV